MEITVATPADYPEVRALYDDVIDAMAGSAHDSGWRRGFYPADDSLRASLAAGELRLARDGGQAAGAMVLNRAHEECYDRVAWPSGAGGDEALVVHLLCVHPARRGEGLAKALVACAGRVARGAGARALRLDVVDGNRPAARLYEGLGFRRVAAVRQRYPDGGAIDLTLYELAL